MVEKVEDLHLPASVVARLTKNALPYGINVSKEARTAISRAASVYIIYLTSTATTLAKRRNHKSINASNILEALEELEFNQFIEPLQQDLEQYRKTVKEKKEARTKYSKETPAQGQGDVEVNE